MDQNQEDSTFLSCSYYSFSCCLSYPHCDIGWAIENRSCKQFQKWQFACQRHWIRLHHPNCPNRICGQLYLRNDPKIYDKPVKTLNQDQASGLSHYQDISCSIFEHGWHVFSSLLQAGRLLPHKWRSRRSNIKPTDHFRVYLSPS